MSNKYKLIYKLIKFAIALFLIFIFLLSFLRQWTNFPRYHVIYISEEQDNLNTSNGLPDYLGAFTMFAFFTTLSNVIAIFLISIEWLSFGKYRINKKIKMAGLLYMLVTGIVFWLTIAPFMPWGFDPFFDYDNFHCHAIVLILMIIFALTDKRKINVNKNDYWWVLVFPLTYLLFSILLNLFTPEHLAVYPFLDFYNFFGLGLSIAPSVILTLLFIVLMLLIFVGIYWILIKLTNKNIINKRGKYD